MNPALRRTSEPVNFSRDFHLASRYNAAMPNDDTAAAATTPTTTSNVRLRRPDRDQVVWAAAAVDELVPQGHQARVIWAVVRKLDLSAFHAPIKARAGVRGRDATDPALLVALWLYANTRGVGSARELDRLCRESHPYRWLCGGVSLNYHTLSDFRVGHGAALDALFTQVLASMLDRDLVKVHRVSQDGTRVRACAGAASFRGADRLAGLLAEAKAHVAELAALLDDPARSAELTARQRSARRRAARERLAGIEAAVGRLPEIKAKLDEAAAAAAAAAPPGAAPVVAPEPVAPPAPKAKAAKGRRKPKLKPRASTTDPDARVMKMGDGGYRPAANVQFAVDTVSRAILGVAVSTVGSDMGLAPPMRAQVERRTGGTVAEHLVDGGFLKLDEIDAAAAAGVTVFVHPKTPSDPAKLDQRYVPKPDDTPHQAAWRARMGTDAAQAVYRERAATVETVNADVKTHRGMARFLVRGTDKATCCAFWSAIAYNLLHFGAQLIA